MTKGVSDYFGMNEIKNALSIFKTVVKVSRHCRLRFQQAAITSILNKGKQLINYFINVGTEGLYLEIS